MKKPGVKPKGKRPLTKAEQQQRVRARLRIINEEMNKAGVSSMSAYMPPVYMKAMRAYEESFHSDNPDIIKSIVFSSMWACRAIEGFIKKQSELKPESELARIFNSPEWVNSNSIGFEVIAINAKLAIHKFEQQHEEKINQ